MNANTLVFQRDALIEVDEEFRKAFCPWAREDFLRAPIYFVNVEATKELMTDASEEGWSPGRMFSSQTQFGETGQRNGKANP